MATISEKIKRALADLETVTKSLLAVDADSAELSTIRTLLDARRAEFSNLEQQIVRTREAAALADAEHSKWLHAVALERARGNEEIDRLGEKLRTVEQQVVDAEARLNNAVLGLRELHARIQV